MKKLILALTVLISAVAFSGCSSLKRTPEQVAADQAAQRAGIELLKGRTWMMQASRLHFGNGAVVQCTPNTNFVIMNGNYATVQVSPVIGGGPNGVGGVTISGEVTNYQAKFDDNGSAFIKFSISSYDRMTDVSISYSKKINNCDIRVQQTFRRYNVTLTGPVGTLDPTLVIEGNNRG